MEQQIQTVFKDRSTLSPHYVPEELPHREKEVGEIMQVIAPAMHKQKPKNLFIFGKTGTGKTCSVKKAVERLGVQGNGEGAFITYINCRIYGSRYRIIQKLLREFVPEVDRSGFGLPFLYEKMLDLMNSGKQLVAVLDEVDMVKDLSELIYTLTRSNDEATGGGASIIGISNNIRFKNELDARSKSSLYENNMIFAPYTAPQLQQILKQRALVGINEGGVDESAVNLAAAIAAHESGDARYALKLFEKAAEIAERNNMKRVTDSEVEQARKSVEIDIAGETISTLPENHKIVLYSIARLAKRGSRYPKLEGEGDGEFLISGEVYEEYS
ncbi:AAA family ATPase, partial [Candidatus Micrarchaeota archaeon]|nr:AAA family ATPase [Candidatus Micrarchaeota archaeon]